MIVAHGLGRGDPTTIVAFGLGRRSIAESAFHAPRTFALLVLALRLATIATARTQAHSGDGAMTAMMESRQTEAIHDLLSMSARVEPMLSESVVAEARLEGAVATCCNGAEIVATRYDATISPVTTGVVFNNSDDDAEVI